MISRIKFVSIPSYTRVRHYYAITVLRKWCIAQEKNFLVKTYKFDKIIILTLNKITRAHWLFIFIVKFSDILFCFSTVSKIRLHLAFQIGSKSSSNLKFFIMMWKSMARLLSSGLISGETRMHSINLNPLHDVLMWLIFSFSGYGQDCFA